MAIKKPVNDPVPVSDYRGPMLCVSKLVTEEVPLDVTNSPHGLTIGQMVDEYIRNAIAEGETVVTMELDIPRQFWGDVVNAAMFKG